MVKCIGMLKRRPGTTVEEFSQYWHEKHGPLVLRVVPGVKRYVQNHPVILSGHGEPQFDGVVELWFDDLESWQKSEDWYLSDDGRVLVDDEKRFVDLSKSVYIVTDERVMKP